MRGWHDMLVDSGPVRLLTQRALAERLSKMVMRRALSDAR